MKKLLLFFLAAMQLSVSPVFASAQTRFLYDGDGVRIAKIEEGKTTLYIGDTEISLSPSLSRNYQKYYSLGSKRIALKDNSSIQYLVSDHLDSTRLLADSTGTPIPNSHISYFPYGLLRLRLGLSSALPSRQYTGQINDSSTQLLFYNARYYNPVTANFTQADRGGGGANKYAYVNGNPINFSDPSGNDEEGIDFAPPSNSYPETGISSSQEINSTIQGPTTCFNMPGGCTQEQIDQWNMESWQMTGQLTFAALTTVMFAAATPALLATFKTVFSGVIGDVAFRLYNRYGNQELSGAVRALKSGNAKEAFRLAEKTWQKVDSGFSGFKITKLPPGYGGLGEQISKDLPLSRQASLAIHETSHTLDMTFHRAHSTVGKNVTVAQHYGLQVESLWAGEAKSYLTELAGGQKSLQGALRDWFFSNRKFTSFPDQLRAVLFER